MKKPVGIGSTKVCVQLYIGIVCPQPVPTKLAPRKVVLDFTTGFIEFTRCEEGRFYKIFAGDFVTLRGTIDGKPVKWIGKLARKERDNNRLYISGLTTENDEYMPKALAAHSQMTTA